MNLPKEYIFDYSYKPKKIAIITARFNSLIVDSLQKGALEAFTAQGLPLDVIETYEVPGAFEIPVLAKRIFAKGEVEGIVALGTVIRGETAHFEYVAGQCASGVMAVSLEYAKPIIFGVLTANTIEQAMDRAGLKAGNKGTEAALALLQTLSVLQKANL